MHSSAPLKRILRPKENSGMGYTFIHWEDEPALIAAQEDEIPKKQSYVKNILRVPISHSYP